jgi:hypothetical protein
MNKEKLSEKRIYVLQYNDAWHYPPSLEKAIIIPVIITTLIVLIMQQGGQVNACQRLDRGQ